MERADGAVKLMSRKVSSLVDHMTLARGMEAVSFKVLLLSSKMLKFFSLKLSCQTCA